MAQAVSEEIKQHWKEKILQQRHSGLSIAAWCRQNAVLVHNFYYWQSKLFSKTPLSRSSFTELAYNKGMGVTIEYQGLRIILDRQFDVQTLIRCLEALKEAAC